MNARTGGEAVPAAAGKGRPPDATWTPRLAHWPPIRSPATDHATARIRTQLHAHALPPNTEGLIRRRGTGWGCPLVSMSPGEGLRPSPPPLLTTKGHPHPA